MSNYKNRVLACFQTRPVFWCVFWCCELKYKPCGWRAGHNNEFRETIAFGEV